MNNDTKAAILPELTAHMLRDGSNLVDNMFADLWKRMGIQTKLGSIGFYKRSGTAAHQLVYCLMLWVWLRLDSISMFARESLQTFASAEKDALYAALNNEGWNWRRLQLSLSLQTVREIHATEESSAFVLDDTIHVRHGKKMPGVSSHFDHTSGRHVLGQQVLTLGLSCAKGFVPVDSELFISKTKARGLHQAFHDGRSIIAQRYKAAKDQTKPQMAKDMIRRAQRTGIKAKYLLADAWFGTKTMIKTADEQQLIPILRMKKNAMKYRLIEGKGGFGASRDLDANALYHAAVRCQWQKIAGQPYQAKTLDVELNLNGTDEAELWIKVRLLFVRGMDAEGKKQAGKHDWAVFLTTDIHLAAEQILTIYSMRWAIEVYFKEAKQYLGFLKEQSNHYAAYIASIHLTAMRFCMLVTAKMLHKANGVSDIRKQLTANVSSIDYATRLWQVFQSVIAGALDEIKTELGDMLADVTETVDRHIQNFFVQTLQLDARTLKLEADKSCS